jgi:hypothetical protein
VTHKKAGIQNGTPLRKLEIAADVNVPSVNRLADFNARFAAG